MRVLVSAPLTEEGVGMSQALHCPRWLVAAFTVVLTAALTVAGGTREAAAISSSPAVGELDQVPDFAMLPLKDFRLSTENGRKAVRFTVDIVNKGGNFELVGSRPDTDTETMTVVQNMRRADGGVRSIPTKATMHFALADGHNHWHVSDFAEYKLRPVGSRTWRGAHKEGFCVRDRFRLEGNAPRGYPNNCKPGSPQELKVTEGLSPGWVDDYPWKVWGQFIYLDGLTLPGDFCVAATADPLRLFTETTRKNSRTTTLVRITAADVRVIRQGC
jgi:hypothetical protein